MKNYNFDEIIDRKGTNALKIEGCKTIFGKKDLIPMWIADMDFKTPDFIIEAIKKRCEHEILGYTLQPETLNIESLSWIKRQHKLDAPLKWANFTPSIVSALAIAVNTFTEKGDNIVVQSPIYPPFMNIIKENYRTILFNQLIEHDEKYIINYQELDDFTKNKKTKLMLLCNPHNPGGRVWTKKELQEIAYICKKNNVIVISDGIHADLALNQNIFISFLSVSDDAKEIGVELFSPSKTFNIAGIGTGLYLIPNEKIRNKMKHAMIAMNACYGSMFSYIAEETAYKYGDQWLLQLKTYLEGNLKFSIDFIEKNMPFIKVMRPEASFLLWMNFKRLAKNDDEINDLLINKANVALNQGRTFGIGGEGYQRLNFGCPRFILKIALEKISQAFNSKI